KYRAMYRRSIDDPDGFWAEQAKRVDWLKPFTKVKNTTYAYPNVSIKWFEDGALNIPATCIDRHLKGRADQVAILWEGDRVTIYMPMIPEAAYAMLACARIGAILSVVFGAFSPDSLANRIEDCR